LRMGSSASWRTAPPLSSLRTAPIASSDQRVSALYRLPCVLLVG
jgi:hypothetical protein